MSSCRSVTLTFSASKIATASEAAPPAKSRAALRSARSSPCPRAGARQTTLVLAGAPATTPRASSTPIARLMIREMRSRPTARPRLEGMVRWSIRGDWGGTFSTGMEGAEMHTFG
ncbi:hypothetical protein CaCOL14_009185 [Colletotrichum acutatum]